MFCIDVDVIILSFLSLRDQRRFSCLDKTAVAASSLSTAKCDWNISWADALYASQKPVIELLEYKRPPVATTLKRRTFAGKSVTLAPVNLHQNLVVDAQDDMREALLLGLKFRNSSFKLIITEKNREVSQMSFTALRNTTTPPPLAHLNALMASLGALWLNPNFCENWLKKLKLPNLVARIARSALATR